MNRLLDRYKETIFGLTPTVLVLASVLLLQSRYDYLRTSIDKTVSGLEPATMYVLDKSRIACLGDVVRYTSLKVKSKKYLRRITAGQSAVFSIGETGYKLDGKEHEMDAAWRDRAAIDAKEQINNFMIPADHVLIVNTEFNGKAANENWAFEILPRKQIDAAVTRILFSRDFSRIGERVTVGECGGV